MDNAHHTLPQLGQQVFLTDGGAETFLIFQRGYDLPCFALFPLLESAQGRRELRDYFEPFLASAIHARCGFILEAPTWRANPDWGAQLGYDAEKLDQINRQAIAFLQELREEFLTADSPIVISGCLGPRGDGYQPSAQMSAAEARDYHRAQIASFAAAGADLVCAMTLNYSDEAIGIVQAATALNIPAVISFTTETDGRLPDGTTLQGAIDAVDRATDHGPAYYMLNCAHPEHFAPALSPREGWVQRIRGIRANASRLSHAELDDAEQLDSGNPEELGQCYRQLRRRFPHINVLGGCCGTDHRHVDAICRHCVPASA